MAIRRRPSGRIMPMWPSTLNRLGDALYDRVTPVRGGGAVLQARVGDQGESPRPRSPRSGLAPGPSGAASAMPRSRYAEAEPIDRRAIGDQGEGPRSGSSRLGIHPE
ncbi:MAG: hypothetical protein M0C28_42010 [Candidatus Moduliflexus flocculans]|nr:hypothetical protein [Candidatus Moduliflexus flocculans]